MHHCLFRFAVLCLLLGVVSCGKPFGAGDISAPELPISALEDKQLRQAGIAVAQSDQQILFGDLHVHSSFSPDAFATGMPIAGGFEDQSREQIPAQVAFYNAIGVWEAGHDEYDVDQ